MAIGFVDIILGVIGLAMGAAIWRQATPRRSNSSPYYVEVCQPESDASRYRIEERRR